MSRSPDSVRSLELTALYDSVGWEHTSPQELETSSLKMSYYRGLKAWETCLANETAPRLIMLALFKMGRHQEALEHPSVDVWAQVLRNVPKPTDQMIETAKRRLVEYDEEDSILGPMDKVHMSIEDTRLCVKVHDIVKVIDSMTPEQLVLVIDSPDEVTRTYARIKLKQFEGG
jgi:hypothetical protein